MSFPAVHSHTFTQGPLPQLRRKVVTHCQASLHQRSRAPQQSLSSCKTFCGQQLSCHQLPARARRVALHAVARQGGDNKREEASDGFQERVVQVRRVTKVVKGGKQLSFRAVVVVGDEQGQVGVGCASAKEVVQAVAKAVVGAKNELVRVPLTNSATFPHRIDGYFGAAKVMLRPASEGTGVIAGGAVRVVLELAGVKNAFGKQLGSPNPLNNARAALVGLSEMRTFKEVAAQRDMTIEEFMGRIKGSAASPVPEEDAEKLSVMQ
ncbi:TPA: ribosomal protein S5 [Trebouxia sp. C0005]|nr:MAG: 30S ribosomal S5 [Trebouxia sp. A1-2]